MNAYIDLLLGANASRAPDHRWRGYRTYSNADKTVFGWVINGPHNSFTADETSRLPTFTTNYIRFTMKKEEMSAEDRKFIQIAQNSVMLKNEASEQSWAGSGADGI